MNWFSLNIGNLMFWLCAMTVGLISIAPFAPISTFVNFINVCILRINLNVMCAFNHFLDIVIVFHYVLIFPGQRCAGCDSWVEHWVEWQTKTCSPNIFGIPLRILVTKCDQIIRGLLHDHGRMMLQQIQKTRKLLQQRAVILTQNVIIEKHVNIELMLLREAASTEMSLSNYWNVLRFFSHTVLRQLLSRDCYVHTSRAHTVSPQWGCCRWVVALFDSKVFVDSAE